jgi:hypothetical protein
LEDIGVGDVLVVFPHDNCPVDGVVLEGQGNMDESYLTGEPYVIPKGPGSEALSGAINGDTALIIQSAKALRDSRYAKIMKVMGDSARNRPNLRRLGDKLGALYAPIVLAIAIGTGWATGEWVRFLAVLVVATPCPLLIAIPVAVIGSVSLCARRGIIIKNPAVLERIGTCRTAIFDKTGTLTYRRPELMEVLPRLPGSPNPPSCRGREGWSGTPGIRWPEPWSKRRIAGTLLWARPERSASVRAAASRESSMARGSPSRAARSSWPRTRGTRRDCRGWPAASNASSSPTGDTREPCGSGVNPGLREGRSSGTSTLSTGWRRS